MKHFSLALLALGTSACLGIEGEDITGVEQQVGGSCPPFMCGNDGNSPEIDMYGGFHSFKNPAMGPERNSGGFVLLGFEKGSYKTNQVRVQGAQLIVGYPGKAPTVDQGYLRILQVATKKEYLIYIKESDQAKYWAKNAAGNMTHTYFIKWLEAPAGGYLPRKEDPEWPNVCSNPSTDNGGENLGMLGNHVVLFETDIIDANRIAVVGQNEAWFNIGCAGHALAKLHLSGHTQGAMNDTSAIVDPYVTKDRHRTTYLKMIAGDYCGTGRPFTIAGMPLNWADIDIHDTGVTGDWMNFASDNMASPNNLELEARWDETGATCLNAPRVDWNLASIPEGKDVYDPYGYASLEDAIKDACGGARPPKCDTDEEYKFDGHHIVSANIK